jgi:hypothetical protein
MLGKLLREAITGPGEGYLHICDSAFAELVRYHGSSPCNDGHAGQAARVRLFDSRRFDRSFARNSLIEPGAFTGLAGRWRLARYRTNV